MELSLIDCDDSSSEITKCMEESGVSVNVADSHSTPQKSKPFFNPKMKTCRELVLTTVGVLIKERDPDNSPVCCLDAFGATGIAGLQWKNCYGESCHVTITERDEICVQSIMGNSISNGLIPKPFLLEFTRVPGLPLESQGRKEVFVKQCDANVMMQMEAFDFIHLDPFGCPVKYLSASFTNIRNNGVMCVVATDLGSLFAKHCNVALRNYAGNLIKTEYVQEEGARLLIAAVARTAAQCNKGVEILYTVNRDHFMIVCLRVKRGAVFTDHSIQQIRNVIHCQICGERVCHPQTQHVIQNPYDLLPCCCHTENLGKTAVQIGPLWCGDIFDVDFVLAMYKQSITGRLSKTVTNLLSTVVFEASCPNSLIQHSTITRNLDEIFRKNGPKKNFVLMSSTDEGCDKFDAEFCEKVSQKAGDSENCEESNSKSLEKEIDTSATFINKNGEELQQTEAVPEVEEHEASSPKRAKLEDTVAQQNSHTTCTTQPLFYYDLHKKKLPGLNLPKTSRVISLLQRSGFKASRTHFCTTAVRTNANLAQIRTVLEKDLSST